MELRRPEEAVPEGSEPCPSNSWLDSFLGRKLQAMGRGLGSPALMNLPSGSVQGLFLQKEVAPPTNWLVSGPGKGQEL